MEKHNRILLILRYLWDNTDIDNPATIKEISDYLAEYGYNATRKTISNDIEELKELGVDVDCKLSVQNQYFVDVRVFELPEIKLLVDAVQSSRFITSKKSKSLIEKLATFAGPNQSDILKRQLYVDTRVKANNEGIYYLVDNIHAVIREKKKVTFKYIEYMPNKKKSFKHNGQLYSFSPYALIWNDDSYYAIGFSDNHNKIVKFRVDRMENLKVSEEAAEKKPKNFDVSDYFSQIFSMYDGEECEVVLRCENELMNSVIDRFGERVQTEPVDDSCFDVYTTVSLSPTFYGWVFSFGGKMKIIGSQQAVDGFNSILSRF